MLFPCIKCGKEVRPQQHSIQCDSCQRWQHRTCQTDVSPLFDLCSMQNDKKLCPSPQQKYPYGEPTHLAQRQDPWNRLNKKCTLASSRREIYHADPQAPNDYLDFVLKSQYDHHDAFLKAKNETLYQPETYTEDHGRVLKNREKEVIIVPPEMGHPLEVTAQKKRESIHSIKNAIESHHTQTTNRSYSRKPDGGFFSS